MKGKIKTSTVTIMIILIISVVTIKNRNIKFITESNQVNQIQNIKNDIGAIGNDDIYEVQRDKTGIETVVVKDEIKYKVAFAGMIKKDKLNINEVDDICYNNYPKESGVWINKKSKSSFINMLNDSSVLNNKYGVNGNGYLQINEEINPNKYDRKLQKAIENESLNIFDISSTCYIVDNITGEILDYSFEDMDSYQTYEYFESENKKIIFITENKENQLTHEEILISILSLLE